MNVFLFFFNKTDNQLKQNSFSMETQQVSNILVSIKTTNRGFFPVNVCTVVHSQHLSTTEHPKIYCV